MQQTETTTVQTGQTTAQAAPVTVETGPTTVQAEPTTLHDFTLGLLTDLDAREAFQQDPLGCLEAAGLSDITAGDVHEILPLVLDAASVPNVDVLDSVLGGDELPAVNSLLQIADNVEGVVGAPVGVGDVAGITSIANPSALTALVSDFSGLGDVSSTLDGTLSQVTNVVPNVPDVSHVTDIASDNALLGNVTDLAGVNGIDGLGNVHDVTNVLVKDVDTDVLAKNVIGAADVAHLDVSDVADVSHVTNVTDNVVQNVAQVGDVHHDLGQVIGDVKLGGIDLLDGGIGNHNNIDIHL